MASLPVQNHGTVGRRPVSKEHVAALTTGVDCLLSIVEKLLAGEAVPANGRELAARMRDSFQRNPAALPDRVQAFKDAIGLGLTTGAEVALRMELGSLRTISKRILLAKDRFDSSATEDLAAEELERAFCDLRAFVAPVSS